MDRWISHKIIKKNLGKIDREFDGVRFKIKKILYINLFFRLL
jgi:hypothetical protein